MKRKILCFSFHIVILRRTIYPTKLNNDLQKRLCLNNDSGSLTRFTPPINHSVIVKSFGVLSPRTKEQNSVELGSSFYGKWMVRTWLSLGTAVVVVVSALSVVTRSNLCLDFSFLFCFLLTLCFYQKQKVDNNILVFLPKKKKNKTLFCRPLIFSS